MTNALVLIADPEKAPLESSLVSAVSRKLACPVRWLADDEACDMVLPADLERKWLAQLLDDVLGEAPVDRALVPSGNRRKRLLVSDMDSTMIDIECIDELADQVGIKAEVAAITRRAMQGELDFAQALEARVALLEGVEAAAIREICAHRLSLNPGARTLVRTMWANGAATLLVSGGFTDFTKYVAEIAGFAEHQGNRLEMKDGKLTGRVMGPTLGPAAKQQALLAAAAERGLDTADAMAVGDGANDVPMLEAAGFAVGFRPHAVLRPAADLCLDHANLAGALYLQGYSASELVRD